MKIIRICKLQKLIVALLFVLFLELVVFQFRSLESSSFKTISWAELQERGISFSGNIVSTQENGKTVYRSTSNSVTLTLENLDCAVKNIFLDVDSVDTSGSSNTLNVNINATDEGHALPFSLPDRTISASVLRSRYLRLHLSGASDSLEINLKASDNDTIIIRSVALNTPVPYQPKLSRLLLMCFFIVLVFILHPTSPLYHIPLFDGEKKLVTNSSMFWIFISIWILCALATAFCFSNSSYVSPRWSHHTQYQKLAVAFSEGHLYLDDEVPEALTEMENPYDTDLRDEVMAENHQTYFWDAAYYNGHYYVYFGVVPVLCFYLPYYLLTHNALPNVIAVLLSGWLCIIAIFWMISRLCRRFFHEISLGFYLLLSLLVTCGSYLFLIFFQPSFYTLPILMGLSFTFAGLGCWLHAATLLHEEQSARRSLFLGSLCMALVAGCRPQLLLGSFFAFSLFGHYLKGLLSPAERFPKFGSHLVAIIFPFVVVALSLFWYNAARFESPFDFGANYNLTTNDMTHRGFVWERLPLGIWRYLFQPANITNSFPFLTTTASENTYMGQTIKEGMYGGALTCNLFCWILIASKRVRKTLKKEGMYSLFLLSIVFVFIIVCADTNMAGLLERYMIDFGWLLMFASVLVTIGLCKTYPQHHYIIQKICLIAFLCTAGYQLLLGISHTGLTNVGLTGMKMKYFLEFWL